METITLGSSCQCELLPFLLGKDEKICEYIIYSTFESNDVLVGHFRYHPTIKQWAFTVKARVELTVEFIDKMWATLQLEIGNE